MTDKEIKLKFNNALKCGLGKAYFILKENPQIDFSKEIQKALLKRNCNDGQMEGIRTHYYYQLLQLISNRTKVYDYILKRLKKGHWDWYTHSQFYELASLIAKEGNQKPKKIIKEVFIKETKYEYQWEGQKAILDTFGKKGAFIIAIHGGKRKRKETDYQICHDEIKKFFKKKKGKKVLLELKEQSLTNKNIKTDLKSLKNDIEVSHKINRKSFIPTYEYLKNKIEDKKILFYPVDWMKELSEEDILKTAQDFCIETNTKKKVRYTKVFIKVKFPFGYKKLLQLTDNLPKENLEDKLKALSFFEKKEIREIFLKNYNRKKAMFYINLLSTNFRKGDSTYINEIIKRIHSKDKVHDLSIILQNLYNKYSIKEIANCLELVYYKLNCGICRYDLVKLLADNKHLSKSIIQELKYDSYKKTRKFYKSIKN